MQKRIVVIDDDLELVTELRQFIARRYSGLQLVGPPELPLDLRGVRENYPGASAIVLDINIGGSSTYGESLLKKLRPKLEKSDTPVVVWSKYLSDTIVFEPAGNFILSPTSEVSTYRALEERELDNSTDYINHIRGMRKIYKGARAFVTKASPQPVELLCNVLVRLGVIVPGT